MLDKRQRPQDAWSEGLGDLNGGSFFDSPELNQLLERQTQLMENQQATVKDLQVWSCRSDSFHKELRNKCGSKSIRL